MGQCPCNPAVGGPGKSHLAREVDALGGIIGIAADATYIQMRTLNLSRGPAVHSLRAQSDKKEYSQWMKSYLESLPNLTLRQGMVQKFLTKNNKFVGVELAFGEVINAKAVVLCAGTFFRRNYLDRKTDPASRQSWGIPGGRLE